MAKRLVKRSILSLQTSGVNARSPEHMLDDPAFRGRPLGFQIMPELIQDLDDLLRESFQVLGGILLQQDNPSLHPFLIPKKLSKVKCRQMTKSSELSRGKHISNEPLRPADPDGHAATILPQHALQRQQLRRR